MKQELPPAIRQIKRLTASLVCVCMLNFAHAQNGGKIIEEKNMRSAILNKDVKYSVYLPRAIPAN
jgi:hypothetical protein